MCSIVGFLKYRPGLHHREAIEDYWQQIVERATERGKDSAGMVTMSFRGQFGEDKYIAPQDWRFVRRAIQTDTTAAIVNLRAEPTTEFVQYKTLDDVQPFVYQSVAVTHNGTIANDTELSTRYGLERATMIDSAVLPPLFYQMGIANGLEKVVGSYGLGILSADQPDTLWLATNYKPIFVVNDVVAGYVWFASQAEYLTNHADLYKRLNAPAVMEVPSYSLVEIRSTNYDPAGFTVKVRDLQPRGEKKKALVVCSGGLDSVTVATWAKREGYDVTLLYFKYGCRAEADEIQAVKNVAEALECDYRLEDLSFLYHLGGNPLVDETMQIARGDSGAEFAFEWVPARNTVMIALAAALCDRYGYDTIMLGLNLEEGGAYPDNTVGFYRAMDKVLDLGTTSRARVICPVANLVKHEIVKLGLELGAPLQHSYSCYEAGGHCSVDNPCGPCRMRRQAFLMNGVDPEVVEREYMR